jgi:hypothetical protein
MTSEYFSPTYQVARARFRSAVLAAGWALESHGIDRLDANGDELTIDVGWSGNSAARRVVVVSSGLHGVEGFLGAAIQLAWLERLKAEDLIETRIVLLHGLNPYGFAERRRWNEDGVDLNRNFLLPGELYSGSPDGYDELNAFFNPVRSPRSRDWFLLEALAWIVRYGANRLKRTLAIGQYDYPQGLFFGGQAPSKTQEILAAHLPRWLAGSGNWVTHVDFHTGLGKSGTYKLFPKEQDDVDYEARLTAQFGAEGLEFPGDRKLSYPIRGGLGQWCQNLLPESRYDFLTAEFGTYPALAVLQAVRAENQAYWHGEAGVDYGWTKERLLEMFNPASLVWQESCVAKGLQICQRAMLG